ncbi:MAG: tetraacyldisaccharide 4'-kinase [Alphaproteobacteria bacterium]|nr:tetraacyldisaccharide 4'-kinase [Alphaproteobacteria bacterium]
MHAPEFWQRDGWPARALAPVGALIEFAGRCRAAATTPYVAPVPVICVGNLTVGGAGKTPVAIAVAERLAATGHAPVFLSRGYGGSLHGPVRIDAEVHGAGEVGDEPLLLARAAPVVIARDRAAGARDAVAAGARAIVMDDGLQNPGLAKTRALVVVDGEAGFGNGRVFPAGPLRERLARGMARANAFVLMGPDRLNLAARLAIQAPVLAARLEPAAAPQLAGIRCLAFAGIGRPAKFFATLRALGAEPVEAIALPDHHIFRPGEAEALVERARRLGLTPVTTAKDQVRLPAALRDQVEIVHVRAIFDAPAALDSLLAEAVRG